MCVCSVCVISNESSFVDGLPVCDQSVEKEFPYLGSIITSNGKIGELLKAKPFHGTKQRKKDVVNIVQSIYH